jgi:hypothetical protein
MQKLWKNIFSLDTLSGENFFALKKAKNGRKTGTSH